MNINPKNKFRLIILSLTVSFISIVILFHYLRGIVDEVKNTKIKIAEVDRDIVLLDKISEDKNQYSADIQKIESTLPSEYFEISFFTAQLENIARNNNLELSINIDKHKKDETESYGTIAYVLEVRGGYPAISDFLSRILKLPYHTSIDKIGISKDEDGIIAKIGFRLFVQK